MVSIPKVVHFYGKFTKYVFFSCEIFTYGNFTMVSMMKIQMQLRNFFSCFEQNYVQHPVLGKFPMKVKISMTISNSASSAPLKKINPESNTILPEQ
jgi:hypothetical protein